MNTKQNLIKALNEIKELTQSSCMCGRNETCYVCGYGSPYYKINRIARTALEIEEKENVSNG